MNDNSLIKHSKKWDRTGVFVASLCLIHCLAFPIFVTFIPATEFLAHNPVIEYGILIVGVFVGLISFFTSYRKHKMMSPMIVGLAGVTLLFMSLLKEHQGHEEVEELAWTTVIGGFLMILAHLWNMRACACHCEKTCSHKHH